MAEKCPKAYVTRKESFCAAHRLHNPSLSDEVNAELFGKCNRKNGHGHNYTVKVTVQGRIDPQTGMVMNLVDVKKHIAVVVEDLDHRSIDKDVPYFTDVTSTAENLAVYFWRRLEESLPKGSLYKVKIHETEKNTATYKGEIHVIDPRHSWEKTYTFDHVFPPESTNPEVCNALCRPIVNSALNGFNGALMAYGQTGSGKTHTLMGPDGITAGVIERCFKKINQDDYHDFKVTLSYLQIYQEKIYDLLNSTNKVDLALREHPDKGVYVENLSEFVVRSPSEIHSLLTVGRKRLIFAETKMNRTSSRSHSVIQLKIERTANKDKAKGDGNAKENSATAPRELKHGHGGGSRTPSPRKMKPEARDKKDVEDQDEPMSKMVSFSDDVLIRGRIYLCDLAGSERLKKTLAEGERLSEAQHINSSLLELGNVIQALAEGKKTHVPFRNSTLTRLLQESLGGNCKTSLMVCVSPAMSDVSETKTTLNFGLRAMKVTNTAYVNVEVDYKRLSDDLSKLLEIRDNDMVQLKDSYESRIEKMRREAEAKLTEVEAETDMALSSIQSLFDSQRSDLQKEAELSRSLLEEQKSRVKDLQVELNAVENRNQEQMNRTKSLLLQELISAQLFYAIRDVSEKEELDQVCFNDDSRKALTQECKEVILENSEKLLEFLSGYFKLWNTSKECAAPRIFEVGAGNSYEPMIAPVGACGMAIEHSSCQETDKGHLTNSNKTDDDKVVASGGMVPITIESGSLDCVGIATEIRSQTSLVEKARNLKGEMLRMKGNLDGKALGYLKQAFGLEDPLGEDSGGSREQVYSRLKELLVLKDDLANTEAIEEVPSVSSLEHSLCHVLVDKALQNSLLVLEQAELKSKCAQLLKENEALELQLHSQQKQADNLQVENTSLNEQFSQTVTILKVVKEQKEQLEGQFSSVFQLYNMTGGSDAIGNCGKEEGSSPHFSNNNVGLKKELISCEQRNQALTEELQAVKRELEELRSGKNNLPNHRSTKTQSEPVPHMCCRESAVDASTQTEVFEDGSDLGSLALLFAELQRELQKMGKAAGFVHDTDSARMRALRDSINGCLGESWSLTVFENEKVRRELKDLKQRIKEEKANAERCSEGKPVAKISPESRRVMCTGTLTRSSEGFVNSSKASPEASLQFKVYDAGEMVADFKVDRSAVLKWLPTKPIGMSKEGNEVNPDQSDGGSPPVDQGAGRRLVSGVALREAFESLGRVHAENKKATEESGLLKGRTQLIKDFIWGLNNLVESQRSPQEDESVDKITADDTGLEIGSLCNAFEDDVELKQLKNLECFLRKKQQDGNVPHPSNCTNGRRELEEARGLCGESNEMGPSGNGKLESEETQKNSDERELDKVNETENGGKFTPLLQAAHECQPLGCDPTRSSPHPHPTDAEDNKLHSELVDAKEKLMRLKAELTFSNTQTKNLGSQLSCLREDSSKLEAELSTMGVSSFCSTPKEPSSPKCYGETIRLELELAEAKERIIDLQERMLSFHQQKAKLQSELLTGKDEVERVNAELENCKKQIGMYDKEIEDLRKNSDRLQPGRGCELANALQEKAENWQQGDQREVESLKVDMALLRQERSQLHQKLAEVSEELIRLESVQDLVQQLISVENEKMSLKERVRRYRGTRNGRPVEKEGRSICDANGDLSLAEELGRTTSENASLKVELEKLTSHVTQLEEELGRVKFKLSVRETSYSNSDKKTLATLLASVRHERAQLKESVNQLILERDNLEDQLTTVQKDGARLQRALAMAGIEHEDLLEELLCLRRNAGVKGEPPSLDRELDIMSSHRGAGNGFANPATATPVENATPALKKAKNKASTMKRKDAKSEKQSPPKRNNTSHLRQSTPNKTPKRGDLVLEFTNGVPRSTSRSDDTTDGHAQTNQPQLLTVSRDLNRDDVSSLPGLGDSGLARPSPNPHARGIPEGMEVGNTDDVLTVDSSAEDPARSSSGESRDEGLVGEVYVKTSWSLRQLFGKSRARLNGAPKSKQPRF